MTATKPTADRLHAAKAALARHAESVAATSLMQMFDDHKGRLAELSLNVAGLHGDFSKLAAAAPAPATGFFRRPAPPDRGAARGL